MLLELCDEVISQFDFIPGIKILGLCWSGLERIGISFLLQRTHNLIQLFNFLFLPKELILLLLDKFLLVDNFLRNFLIIILWPLKLLDIHIPIPLQFLNKTFILAWILLLISYFCLKLYQTTVDSFLQFLELLFLDLDFVDLGLDSLGYCAELVVTSVLFL